MTTGEELRAFATQVAEAIERGANVRALFGEPVVLGGRTLIPVARVFVATGAGAGAGDPTSTGSSGAGGGLVIHATPAGFIQEDEGMLTFTRIDVPEPGWLAELAGTVGQVVSAALRLAAAVAGRTTREP